MNVYPVHVSMVVHVWMELMDMTVAAQPGILVFSVKQVGYNIVIKITVLYVSTHTTVNDITSHNTLLIATLLFFRFLKLIFS